MIIILTILKIIGITILVILAFLLLLILLVLLVPIRYRARASKVELYQTDICLSWLLHIVTVRIRYKKEWYAKVKVFGIPIYDLLSDKNVSEDTDSEKKKKNKIKKEKRISEELESDSIKSEEYTRDQNNQGNQNDQSNQNIQSDSLSEREQIEMDSDFGQKKDKKQKKNSKYKKNKNVFRDVIKKIIRKLKEFWKSVVIEISNLVKKIRRINKSVHKKKELVEYYIRLFEAESTKRALEKLKKQLGRLLKHIKPNKFHANVLIGSKDPYMIGQAYSVYGIFYQLIGNHVFLSADFEEDRLEGDLFLKGRITVVVLLFIAWKVVFDKEIKRLYKRVLREEM